MVRRDTNKKESVPIKELKRRTSEMLEEIQSGLFEKAKKLLNGALVEADNMASVKGAISGKKIALVPLCGDTECEDMLKSETGGAKVLNIPEKQPAKLGKSKCIVCGKKAQYFGRVAKSY